MCRHCGHHFRVPPTVYRDLLLDRDDIEELYLNVKSADPLKFKAKKKYSTQLESAIIKTGQNDAINCYSGKINEKRIILGVMNFAFIGGSMGSVVGELVSRVCTSGGARMQESALSLMQLAKTSAKLARFQDEGGLFIPILTDPTTGGVTASFGMLGDIILAEPGALIGFAGPRVIKQTIGENLPDGFQRAEFLQDKGFVDHIVPREKLKETISNLIGMLTS